MGHEDAVIACRTGKDFPVSSRPAKPAAVAVLKSMAGTRLSTADTMFWFGLVDAAYTLGGGLVGPNT